jgi:hypothetical protein
MIKSVGETVLSKSDVRSSEDNSNPLGNIEAAILYI